MKSVFRLLMIITFSCLLGACERPQKEPEDIGSPTWPEKLPKQIDFVKHIRPIIVINCIECHNSKDAAKYLGVNLQTKQAALTSGINGPVIIPGDPDKSLMIQVLSRDQSHQWSMPPTPDGIWGVRLEILRRWIKEGANWPDGIVLEHPSDIKSW